MPRSGPTESSTLSARAARKFDGHALIGYFNPNSTGGDYVALSDVSDAYDAINMYLAVVHDDTPFGGVIFQPCLLPQCKDGRVQEDVFIAAVKDKVAKGKLMQLGVFWDSNFGQLVNDAAQAKFIETVTSIVDKYGFNGIDLNEFGFPTLDDGDDDFEQPKTTAVLNYIQTLRTIKAKYGDAFGLSFTIRWTSFQLSSDADGYRLNGAYLPVIHALRDDISTLCIHHFDGTNNATDAVLDRNGATVSQDSPDYWVAMVDRPLSGFLAGRRSFPPFAASQVAVGMVPWNPSSQDAFRVNLENGLKCVMTGQACAAIRTQKGPFPDFLGAAGFTIEADEQSGGPFRVAMRSILDTTVVSATSSSQSALPPSSTSPSTVSTSSTPSTSDSSNLPSTSESSASRHGVAKSTLIPAIIVPIVVILFLVGLVVLFCRRRKRNGSVEDMRWPFRSAARVQRNGDPVEPYWQRPSATAADSETSSPPKGVAAKTHVDSPPGDIATSSRAPDTGDLNRLAALQTEMGRVGLTTEALQASLSRLRLGSQGASTEYTDSDVPPPSYVTRP